MHTTELANCRECTREFDTNICHTAEPVPAFIDEYGEVQQALSDPYFTNVCYPCYWVCVCVYVERNSNNALL